MKKQKTLAERIKKIRKTPYQLIAEKYDTSEMYVGQIATGVRTPIRGKGLKIKQELEKLVNNE